MYRVFCLSKGSCVKSDKCDVSWVSVGWRWRQQSKKMNKIWQCAFRKKRAYHIDWSCNSSLIEATIHPQSALCTPIYTQMLVVELQWDENMHQVLTRQQTAKNELELWPHDCIPLLTSQVPIYTCLFILIKYVYWKLWRNSIKSNKGSSEES